MRSVQIWGQIRTCTDGGARERPAVLAPGPGQSIQEPEQPERRDHSPQDTGRLAPRSAPPLPHRPLPGQRSSSLAFYSSELILSLGHMASCLLPGTSWTGPPIPSTFPAPSHLQATLPMCPNPPTDVSKPRGARASLLPSLSGSLRFPELVARSPVSPVRVAVDCPLCQPKSACDPFCQGLGLCGVWAAHPRPRLCPGPGSSPGLSPWVSSGRTSAWRSGSCLHPHCTARCLS